MLSPVVIGPAPRVQRTDDNGVEFLALGLMRGHYEQATICPLRRVMLSLEYVLAVRGNSLLDVFAGCQRTRRPSDRAGCVSPREVISEFAASAKKPRHRLKVGAGAFLVDRPECSQQSRALVLGARHTRAVAREPPLELPH